MKDPIELISTVLLSLAAVAITWSGYQAARWNGEQTKAASRTNGVRIQAARAQGLAESQTQIDVATFAQWVDAYAQKDKPLAEFYFQRFRSEFRPAVTAWLATRPLRNPDAPLTPFAMAEYHLEATDDVRRLDRAAEASARDVRQDIQRATNYVLAVVLFTVALFFASMSVRFEHARFQRFALGLGCVVFACTLAWVATSPISVSV